MFYFGVRNYDKNVKVSFTFLDKLLIGGGDFWLEGVNTTLDNPTIGCDTGMSPTCGERFIFKDSTITINNPKIIGDIDFHVDALSGSTVVVNSLETSNNVYFHSEPNSSLTGSNIIYINPEHIRNLWTVQAGAKAKFDNSDIEIPRVFNIIGSSTDDTVIDITNTTIKADNIAEVNGNGENVHINVTGSHLSGDITGSAPNVTLTQGNWTPKNDNSVNNLNMDAQSSLDLSQATDQYNTFTINKNLTGSGTFILDGDLVSGNSDKIHIKGESSGHFNVTLNTTDFVPINPHSKFTLIDVESPEQSHATFSLKNRFEDLGAYRYRMYQENHDWLYGNRHGELSEWSNALVSLRQAELLHLEQSLVGIHDRLGELKQGKQNNVWVRSNYSRFDFDSTAVDSESRTSGFSQKYYSLQLGADIALHDLVRVGGFVGTARSNVDYNGDYGEGRLTSQMAGLYATLQTDNGWYWDNIAKFERVKVKSDGVDSHNFNAYSLSTEVGKAFNLASWTVTPNAQFVWTKTNSVENQTALSALTSRAGVRVAKAFAWDSMTIQPYAEVNMLNVKNNDSTVYVNTRPFNVAQSGNRVETALGVNAQTGNHRFGLEMKRANGNRVDEKLAVQAVYRYSW
ncbi:autotransporter outer membrane beta-barrel domain-containing protein [Lonepinella sp. BR2271]|uniref:autotransporter outer membrane beta-barrel domain-containing protein n=1 Tax=Lonepinella sp. BR2271 TaxID=3434550 RepID=UPI003F6DD59A